MVLGIHSINCRWDFYFMGTKLLLFLYIIFSNLCIIIVMLFALGSRVASSNTIIRM